MKNFRISKSHSIKKILASCSTSLLTGLICTSVAASDIDIYQNATEGDVTLMFMLDISGSMSRYNSSSDGYACDLPSNVTDKGRERATEAQFTGGPQYIRAWCKGSNGQKYYDRITRVKDGMMDLLYGNPGKGISRISDDKIIGLSTLGAYTTTHHDAGAIVVPARRLSTMVGGKTQRQVLIETIGAINNFTNTPTSRSYAETVAYLMGTTTAAYQRTVTNMPYFRIGKNSTDKAALICTSWNSTYTTCNTWEAWTHWDNLSNPTKPFTSENPSVAIENLTETDCSFWHGLNYYNNNYSNKGKCFAFTGVIEVSNSITGFNYSTGDAKNGELYQSPASLNQSVDGKQCSGQGIYVLTDGDPSSDTSSLPLAQGALGNFGSTFSCDNTSWDCIHKLAASILDDTKNPKFLKFKTAVVGFGSSFNGIPSFDRKLTQQVNINNINNSSASNNIKNAAKWGVNAEGGWYSGNSSQDIVDSVNSFLGDLGKEIPAVTTGTPEIPIDALNPSVLQNYAYYPQFQPTPATSSQVWLGNVKKFKVSTSGALVDKFDRLIADSQGRILQKVANQLAVPVEIFDLWSPHSTPTISDTEKENAITGGIKLQLNLDKALDKERNLYTDRQLTTKLPTSELKLLKINDLETMGLKWSDKERHLIGLLGRQVKSSFNPVNSQNNEEVAINASHIEKMAGYRFGAVMHSTPTLITNGGQVKSVNNALITQNREDYILFGTSQGVLHVVDAETGKEKFAFVPNAMIEDQSAAFGDPDASVLGKDRMFYGVDGPWTVYTEYVLAPDSTYSENKLTVGTGKTEGLSGKQLAYGGLRMGGREYYALDLSNINKPELKFKISPSGTCSESNPLGCMGQSWSKPTITHVNWEGEKTLVMFVGGGYDAGGVDGNAKNNNGEKQSYTGYEDDNYEQTNKRGAGVYMFNALTGKLLWWSGADATLSTNAYEATPAADMKFSVVSQIKVVDRNADGLSDHLYFGDLGGQLWRIDLNNDREIGKEKFAKEPVKLLALGGTENKRRRFYEAPAFSTYTNGNTIFGVVSIGSGNRSRPLMDYTVETAGVPDDGVYNVYDKDVARSDLYDIVELRNGTKVYKLVPSTPIESQAKLKTVGVTLDSIPSSATSLDKKLVNINNDNRFGTATRIASYDDTQGWYYLFKSFKSQSEKVFSTPLVINNDLYVTTFDGSKPGSSGACGAGVKGESFITLFCMPYGQCTTGSADSYKLNLGAGIVGGAIGAGDVEGMIRRIVATRDTTGLTSNEILNRKYLTQNSLIPQRWYVKQ